MKTTNVIFAGFVMLLIGCTKHQGAKKEERVLISPFHITKVMMRPLDSTEAGKNVSLPYDQVFLSESQFALFDKTMWGLFRDSTTSIYRNGGLAGEKPLNKKEFLDLRKDWNQGHFTAAECYEAWYFNPGNNMIEREVLGYALMEYIRDKQAYRMLGYVFKNEAARKTVGDSYMAFY